jgi:DNA-binding SARP family transcriptional activator
VSSSWSESAAQILALPSRLADTYEQNCEYERVLACIDKMIRLEPWRESAYRRQMRMLAAVGEREQALHQYELLREILLRELGALPLNETRQLYEKILNEKLPEATTA